MTYCPKNAELVWVSTPDKPTERDAIVMIAQRATLEQKNEFIQKCESKLLAGERLNPESKEAFLADPDRFMGIKDERIVMVQNTYILGPVDPNEEEKTAI